MDRSIGAAATLPESDRRALAIQALAGSETVSDLAARHRVSRKFVYEQTHKARTALDDALLSAGPEDEVLFDLTVTKALPLICHCSYRGVIEFLRDLLGVSISMGTIHNLLQSAARQAGVINHEQEPSGIPVGLHDEIFQGSTPELAGVCAASTYCYLLVAAEHRDADTWGMHMLDTAIQRLKPVYTIADAGQGLCAGQKAAWGETPCHGDVFHVQHQYERLANTLSPLARGARSRRQRLENRTNRAGQHDPDDRLAIQPDLARQIESQASCLARDVRTLTQWLSNALVSGSLRFS